MPRPNLSVTIPAVSTSASAWTVSQATPAATTPQGNRTPSSARPHGMEHLNAAPRPAASGSQRRPPLQLNLGVPSQSSAMRSPVTPHSPAGNRLQQDAPLIAQQLSQVPMRDIAGTSRPPALAQVHQFTADTGHFTTSNAGPDYFIQVTTKGSEGARPSTATRFISVCIRSTSSRLSRRWLRCCSRASRLSHDSS